VGFKPAQPFSPLYMGLEPNLVGGVIRNFINASMRWPELVFLLDNSTPFPRFMYVAWTPGESEAIN
jgi:hypothetical protein